MGKIAFVFSGQGAQYSGMGKELYDCSPAAKNVFDIADKIREGTSAQCFTAPVQELSVTINTQPCLYCVDLAAAASLLEAGISPDAAAGFSLGEIAALAFSNAFSYADGFRLVCKRAEFMQRSAEKTQGAMAAILGLPNEKVEELCALYDKVFPVNYNCPRQLVVAGEKQQLQMFYNDVKSAGGKAIPLAVSGGFHCAFMNEASDLLYKHLQDISVMIPSIPVYSNYTASPYDTNVKHLISKQLNNPVMWQKTVDNMIADGIDTFIEVGAGKTLCGLIKKINPNVNVYNVENKESLQITLSALCKGE